MFVLAVKLIESILGPLLVWLSAIIIDGLLQDYRVFAEHGHLFWIVLLFVLLTVLVDVLDPIVKMNKKLLTAQIQKHIDELLMEKANSFEDIAPFDDQNFYTKIKTIRHNDYVIELWLEMTSNTFGGFVQIIGGTILIWTVVPLAPVLFVLLALPRVFVEAKLNNVTFEGRAEVQELRRRANYYMSIPLNHELANEVKMYGLTPFFKEKYQSATRQLIRMLSGDQKKWTFHNMGWGAVEAIASGFVLIFIVKQAASGQVAVGELLLFIGALYQLREGINELFAVFAIGARELVNIRNMAQFLEIPSGGAVGTLPISNPVKEGFVLEQVTFGYKREHGVLNIDYLALPQGKVTVLVGENGAGKSTLVKLLLRLLRPESGTITYNGLPLDSYHIDAFRSNATAVFQDFVRYEATLKMNISIGHLGCSGDGDAIANAAVLGGADGIASKLPDRYDTELGRFFGGIPLSGGQWQRVAMSRAYMRDRSAQVLIFDEPTSALDPFMEHDVVNRLKQLGKKKTVIIVSHRLSTARQADYIVLLSKGKVLETGNHDTLMKRGGAYAELYHMQASKYEATELPG
ncbi:ABC transporter [Paenibacillus alvei]|uniref:ABC transporter n=2 Tax=Paenibacillus alvei TaxID=44250 RepID=A0A383R656_PAEAL|nr:ABC transporter [Paenibacillus alvei]